MPNWVSNVLTVTGEKVELEKFKSLAVGHYPWDEKISVLCFHRLIPVPPGLNAYSYHDWTIKHWGCRYGSGAASLDVESERELVYWFESANSPPEEFLKAVGKLWPNLTFTNSFVEPINMRFAWVHEVQGDSFDSRPTSIDAAITNWREEAEIGDQEAQYNLGVCFFYGKGVKENMDEAVSWWAKAAAQGHDDAIEAITTMANCGNEDEL